MEKRPSVKAIASPGCPGNPNALKIAQYLGSSCDLGSRCDIESGRTICIACLSDAGIVLEIFLYLDNLDNNNIFSVRRNIDCY